MMAQRHPSDLELFELVDGELAGSELQALEAHLAGCETCTATVAEARRGREALAALPLLELPAERLASVLAGLPAQEREAPGLRGFALSPRRLALALAPVAVVVVAVVAIVSTTGGGEQGEPFASREAAPAAEEAQGGGEASADASAGDAAAPQAEAPLEEAAPLPPASIEAVAAPISVRSVAGPSVEVERLLEQAGLTVVRTEAAPPRVHVRGGTEADVAEALAGLPDGEVEVLLVPPAP